MFVYLLTYFVSLLVVVAFFNGLTSLISSPSEIAYQRKAKNKESVIKNTPIFKVGRAKRTKPQQAKAIAKVVEMLFKRDDKFFITEIFLKIII